MRRLLNSSEEDRSYWEGDAEYVEAFYRERVGVQTSYPNGILTYVDNGEEFYAYWPTNYRREMVQLLEFSTALIPTASYRYRYRPNEWNSRNAQFKF